MTLTSFKGTPKYASEEMMNLFSFDEKKGYVDLYYNDLLCLNASKEELV